MQGEGGEGGGRGVGRAGVEVTQGMKAGASVTGCERYKGIGKTKRKRRTRRKGTQGEGEDKGKGRQGGR